MLKGASACTGPNFTILLLVCISIYLTNPDAVGFNDICFDISESFF